MLKYCVLFVFLFSAVLGFADEINLSRFEKSIYSRNGEDGVLAKIFQVVQPSSRFCIELGAGEGVNGSSTYLLRKQGWKSLLLDRGYEIPEIQLFKAFITAENLNAILEKHHAPLDLDLLVIDLGYNDFYIWKALSEKYKPSVVLINYNPGLATEDKVVLYRPFYCGDGTDYFGASIRALNNLGKNKGYTLVYAEKSGRTLFFIRDDILTAKMLSFRNANDVEKLFSSLNSETEIERVRPDPKQRVYVSSETLLKHLP